MPDRVESGAFGSDGVSLLTSGGIRSTAKSRTGNNLDVWMGHKQIDTKQLCHKQSGGHAGSMMVINPDPYNPGNLTDNGLMTTLWWFEMHNQQSRS